MSNQPEIVFRHGACTAFIFAHEYPDNKGGFRTERTVRCIRRFKDKQGNWQESSEFSVNDIPKAVLVLNKAYEYITSGDIEDS